MPVTVLATTTVNPSEPAALAEYIGVTGPLLEQVGARITATYEVTEMVIGETLPALVTLVEYPDIGAVRRLFESSEYQALGEIRRRAFLEYRIGIVDS